MSRPGISGDRVGCRVLGVTLALAVALASEKAHCIQQAVAQDDSAHLNTSTKPPLELKVDVSRWGRSLKLQLRDRAGKKLSVRNRAAEPPGFTVFKDGRQIASGRFEYG